MKIKAVAGDWKHARLFLDTSALLKWIYPEFKEKGTENLKNYIEIGVRCSTSEHCIGELLGILKRKKDSKKESPNFKTDNYLQAISFLNYKIDNNRIAVHSIKLSEKFHEISNLVVCQS